MLNRPFPVGASCACPHVRAQDSLNVRQFFHWDDPSIPDRHRTSNQYNEVWGYAANGREYAIIGSTTGHPHLRCHGPSDRHAGGLRGGPFPGTDVVHRDYKTYAHHLYAVCDEGQSSLQVMDLPLPAGFRACGI